MRDFPEENVHLYNRPEFIENDPVQDPHLWGSRLIKHPNLLHL